MAYNLKKTIFSSEETLYTLVCVCVYVCVCACVCLGVHMGGCFIIIGVGCFYEEVKLGVFCYQGNKMRVNFNRGRI